MVFHLKKEQFERIRRLLEYQPWLEYRQKELMNLLFSECQSKIQQETVSDLIQSFTYLSDMKYNEAISKIANYISKTDGAKAENTIVSAMAIGSGMDSSQEINYRLKNAFEKIPWRGVTLLNRCDHIEKTINRINQGSSREITKIFIVDEFIGSGKTVKNRFELIKRFGGDIKVEFVVICATKHSLDFLRTLEVGVHAIFSIEKGISDKYSVIDVCDRLGAMKELESILSSSFNGRNMPSLGYGEAESLYFRENGNTPNSVFPIFWWKFLKDEQERITILNRAMDDA